MPICLTHPPREIFIIYAVGAREIREFTFWDIAFPGGSVGFISKHCIDWWCSRSVRYWWDCSAGLHNNLLGGGVVDAPAADASSADGQIWPSPYPALCTTGAMLGGGNMAGFPSCNNVSIMSAVDPECFVLWGKLVYHRVYVLYDTIISESSSQIWWQMSEENWSCGELSLHTDWFSIRKTLSSPNEQITY